MKETTITKFECEICHQIYDTKEAAINCEKIHEGLENFFMVKKFCYNEDCYPDIKINFYPNAKYRKEDDTLQLTKDTFSEDCRFKRKYWYRFDEIQYDEETNEIKLYTTNFDEDYEKECIEKIINFRINQLNDKIKKLKETDWTKNIKKTHWK